MKSRWPVILVAALVASCTATKRDGGYYPGDGPPGRVPVNVDKVPDAVPRVEPLSEYGNDPYTAFGTIYRPVKTVRGYRVSGQASWYGRKFHGRRTSSGEPYNMYLMTAAHPTLPLPSYVRVTNLENNRTVVLRVNDRGPFLHERVIDVSYAAAHKLGMLGTGTARVEVVGLVPGESPSAGAAASPVPVVDTKVDPIAPPADTLATESPSGALPGPSFYVQVGAFSDFANATALKTRLEASGHAPVEVGPAVVDRQTLYRVRVGPVASHGDAQRTLERLAGTVNATPRVVIETGAPGQEGQ